MDSVEIVLPISRPEHLHKLFASLEYLDCNPDTTSLLAYVDGDQALFEQASKFTEASKFKTRRCVHRPQSKPTYDKEIRRHRIAAIHNELTALVGDCKYVFGLEDDTIPPRGAFRTLLKDHAIYPFAGFIEGVELGRWGFKHVGAWRCDNVYEPTVIETIVRGMEKHGELDEVSMMPDSTFEVGMRNVVRTQVDVEEIDAGGFYCFLTRRDLYTKHEFKLFQHNLLGPDVDYGISLRREGLKNYIDWSIGCAHLRQDGTVLKPSDRPICQVRFTKTMIGDRALWKQKVIEDKETES